MYDRRIPCVVYFLCISSVREFMCISCVLHVSFMCISCAYYVSLLFSIISTSSRSIMTTPMFYISQSICTDRSVSSSATRTLRSLQFCFDNLQISTTKRPKTQVGEMEGEVEGEGSTCTPVSMEYITISVHVLHNSRVYFPDNPPMIKQQTTNSSSLHKVHSHDRSI